MATAPHRTHLPTRLVHVLERPSTPRAAQPVVEAALKGRLLVLEGLEKAERNLLPIINNLLENVKAQSCRARASTNRGPGLCSDAQPHGPAISWRGQPCPRLLPPLSLALTRGVLARPLAWRQREMALEDGGFLMHPERYDSLLADGASAAGAAHWRVVAGGRRR